MSPESAKEVASSNPDKEGFSRISVDADNINYAVGVVRLELGGNRVDSSEPAVVELTFPENLKFDYVDPGPDKWKCATSGDVSSWRCVASAPQEGLEQYLRVGVKANDAGDFNLGYRVFNMDLTPTVGREKVDLR